MNGAQLFAQCLKAQGVEWMATLCGHGLNQIYHACLEAGIRLIDVRNEQTAAYMAECWGRLSRQVGVCASSSGVAHANALTGVVNAHFDGAPMLLLTGAGPRETAGLGHFQDLDQVALAAPVCKYARTMDVPGRIPEFVHAAFAAALSGRPGPVHLSFPMDVQEAQVEGEPLKETHISRGKIEPSRDAVRRMVELLEAAQRPLLVAGSGAFYGRAERPLADFARAYAVPVLVPIWDRGTVEEPLEEFMGAVGAASGGPGLLEEADLVILVGAAADYRVGYLKKPPLGTGARTVRVDVDLGRPARGESADLEVLADPGPFLERVLEACIERTIDGFEKWLAQAKTQQETFGEKVKASARRNDKPGRLHALDIIDVLARVLAREDVLVVDGGNIGQWFHQTLGRRRYPGHWLSCGSSGVVGYGIGGAMAARLLYPRRKVVLLSGDGAATFTIAELERAARQQLPFLMIVADDESWGITESGHRKRFGRAMSSTLGPVDFSQVARGLGALGARAEEKGELEKLVRQGLGERLPTLVHVPIAGGAPEAF
jgi:acetolactate synthase-1/2/3 large subunit